MDYLTDYEKEFVEILKKYSQPMHERLTKMDMLPAVDLVKAWAQDFTEEEFTKACKNGEIDPWTYGLD